MSPPRALLLDLDDTILDDSGSVVGGWQHACASHADRFGTLPADTVVDAIRRVSKWFWDDPERHRTGRLELDRARREVARLAFAQLALNDLDLADSVGDAYSRYRDAAIVPVPRAIETVKWLRRVGSRLALLTNGAGPPQRRKLERFELARFFDVILVEGELGFGKPDPRIYQRALHALGATPSESWMIGDNLDFDVGAPQKLGITAMWIDVRGAGLPPDSSVRPARILRSLADLCDDI
jgi:putative hydrolase of the HAD superfamily